MSSPYGLAITMTCVRTPHSALGYLTPVAYAAALQSKRDDALECLDGSANHPVDQPAQMRKMQPSALDHIG